MAADAVLARFRVVSCKNCQYGLFHQTPHYADVAVAVATGLRSAK